MNFPLNDLTEILLLDFATNFPKNQKPKAIQFVRGFQRELKDSAAFAD